MEIKEDVTQVKKLEVTITSNDLEQIILAHLKKEFKAQGVDTKGLDKAQITIDVPYDEGSTDTRVRIVFPECQSKVGVWSKEE